jgi:hypothetical protein
MPILEPNERAKRFVVFSSPLKQLVIPTGAYPNSRYATPERSTCAAFIEESRMQFASVTSLERNSGKRSGGTCCAPIL